MPSKFRLNGTAKRHYDRALIVESPTKFVASVGNSYGR